jgi:adenosylmethionine-8-amino-7-oxononanoate aminotransferase
MGVLFYPGHGSVDGTRGDHLMVAPPYTVSEQEMRAIVNTLRQGVEQVERSRDRRDHPA